MTDPRPTDPRTRLPGLTRLLRIPAVETSISTVGHAPMVEALREVLAEARDAVVTGGQVPADDRLAAEAITRVEQRSTGGLRPVINATGVLLHTNLGRSPLSDAAIGAVVAAAGPTDLELDLATGDRGGRGATAQDALARLTGAAAALVVNNGAAALVLALMAIAKDREVVISRGELVEIGGSFRLPDIMETAGCRLCEIGTTNRTHIDDYRRAIGEDTGAILRVHPSNYRIDGFVHRPTTAEIAEVARAAGLPFLDDIGSGLLRADPAAQGEPVAAEAIAQGADLVIFSGDKLLGGPQAGILVGDATLIDRCRRAPLARALRIDKLRMAGLEATLAAYERGTTEDLPVWSLARTAPEDLRARAERLAARSGGRAVETEAVLGGGSAPGGRLPSWGVELPGPPDALAERLRTGDPAVVVRIVDDRVVVDLRSVPVARDTALAGALTAALVASGAEVSTGPAARAQTDTDPGTGPGRPDPTPDPETDPHG
jgi:L-seryl-tRNA(Ser) seleniumtransferase